MTAREAFEGWAFLELMGHRKLAGHLSEATIGGGSFIRIDVPSACEGGPAASWCPLHGDCSCKDPEDKNDDGCPLHDRSSTHGEEILATQFYAPGAVYCITPTTEDMARRFAARCKPAPVEEWELPKRPALPLPSADPEVYDRDSCSRCGLTLREGKCPDCPDDDDDDDDETTDQDEEL